MPGYQQQKEHSALHKLDEAVPLLVYFLENQNGDLPLALQNQEDGNVELDDGLGLQFRSVVVPLELLDEYIVESAETVVGGLLAAVGQVLADGQVGLVGVVVGRAAVEVASSLYGYLSASLYLLALKFW